MAVLKKAELENDIKAAIANSTHLWCDVKVVEQHCDDVRHPTYVTLKVYVAINGRIDDMPLEPFER